MDIFISLVCLLLTYLNTVKAITHVYLLNHCSQSVTIHDDIIVSLSNSPRRAQILTPCQVKFLGPEKRSLVLHWAFFDIGRRESGHEWMDITAGSYDISHRRWGFRNSRVEFYPKTMGKLQDYQTRAHDNVMIINYYGTPKNDNFTAVLTSFVKKNQVSCQSGFRACKSDTNMCVPSSMFCNTYQNCPDFNQVKGGDENNCMYYKRSHDQHKKGSFFDAGGSTAVVTVSVLAILVFLTLVVMILYFCKKTRNLRIRHRRFYNDDRFLDIDHQPAVQRPSVLMLSPPDYTANPEDGEICAMPPAYTENDGHKQMSDSVMDQDQGQLPPYSEHTPDSTVISDTNQEIDNTDRQNNKHFITLGDTSTSNPESSSSGHKSGTSESSA